MKKTNIELTKEAKKALAVLYKEYTQRRKAGQRKDQATFFDVCPEEVREARLELTRAGFLQSFFLGGVSLTDSAIVFMENKLVETIKEWLSFGAQFLPLIP